ncbi:Phosphoribosylformylglycinamidine synthase, glutamine amidotransferase subunit [hydrothermal vent metagenome]|uniref:Phosphoribosylformylglycinamidine synthase, glutamine amidotransferase subunit n=1 Tax=hydrothermal vent metagenome TaxID=652676 RepID=A0A3B1CIY7_9ZZZZ
MKFAIIEFPGSNCDHDCHYAITGALGHQAEYVWYQENSLAGFDIVILPGGFSYGDYLRAGAIARFSPVMDAVARFANEGGPVLGICNGFQILTEAGLLPGALMRNVSMKFVCKNIYIKAETSDSFLTHDIDKGDVLSIPVAHMEGRYVADDNTLKRLEDDDRVLFRYCDPSGEPSDKANPNGSLHNIAGIVSTKRNVAGMMPHPERVCEEIIGGVDGLKIFQSMISYLTAV